MKAKIASTSVAILLSALRPAGAELLLSEGFDYLGEDGADALIHGQDGGTGFTSSWETTSAGQPVSRPGTALTHDLVAAAGRGAWFDASTGSESISRRALVPASLFSGNGTFWFSFLVRAPTPGNAGYVMFGSSSTTTGFGVYFRDTCAARIAATTDPAPAPFAAAATNLIVGRYAVSTAATRQKLDVWVNPTPAEVATVATLGNPDTSVSRTSMGSSGGYLLLTSGSSQRYNYDEIRLGTELKDVLHVRPGGTLITVR